MLLRVISAEWELYRGEVEKVSLPADGGILWILPWHINLVTPLVAWQIAYVPLDISESSLASFADNYHTLPVVWWLAMIEDDVVTIVAD